jgi:SAM-dependent methyltransferase
VPRRDPRTHPRVHGFETAAPIYERARPNYPAPAIRFLGRTLHLGPGTTVVEIGSGTGKFTRALAPLGAARVAIEPTAGMRAVFRRAVPDVPVVDGTAEAIPLPDGFADAVVCAQAFHWFRPRPALREIARVLRPGGGLGLVWNVRNESAGWSRELTRLMRPYGWRSPAHRDRRWQPTFRDPSSPFGPLHRKDFPHAQRGPPPQFVERVLSVSAVAVQPAAERRRIAARVRALLRKHPETRGRSVLEMPYTTEVYWAFRRPQEG